MTDPAQPSAITWRGQNGYLGKVKAFNLQWGLIRKPGTPWVLYCFLPGFKRQTWDVADETAAQVKADALLRSWLEATGLKAAGE